MKSDGSLARNIDFEVANLEVIRKLVGKHRFWSYNKVWNLEDVSQEMLVLMLPRVSSRVSGFPVASPCLWGKLQNMSFSKVSKRVVMLFCAALCDIPTGLMTCGKTFCAAGTVLLRRFHKMSCSFRGRRSMLYGDLCRHFAWQAQHFRRVALRALHSTLYTLRSTQVRGLHFTLYTYTLHFTLRTPHSTLHTLHFMLHTPHFTLRTLPYTLHFTHSRLYTLQTLHFPLHTLLSTLHTLHSTLLTLHSTLYTPHFTLHTLHSTLYTPHSTLHTPHSTLYTPHSTLYTSHSTLYTWHSTLDTLPFTLYTLHSTLHTPYFALHPLPHSTVYNALVG